MRSGHYKISNRKELPGESKKGFFRSTQDIPVLASVSSKGKSLLESLPLRSGARLRLHKSCENVRQPKIEVFDDQLNSCLREEASNPTEDRFNEWPDGRVITVPPRSSKLRTASSHSSLHAVNMNEGHIYSASSGYSSSNSSSYGSFKSSNSESSSLYYKSSHSTEFSHIDNPLYDIPALPPPVSVTLASIEDAAPIYIPPLDQPEIHPREYQSYDHIAEKCKIYFEKRTKSSYRLNKASGTGTPSMISLNQKKQAVKTPLETKIEFLRKEIAGLMHQDDTLFKQLLALHDSISTLKTHNILQHTHSPRRHPVASQTFNKEQKLERSLPYTLTNDKAGSSSGESSFESTQSDHPKIREEDEEEEDEGHCTDLSLEHSSSLSPSPSSTISSQSSKSSSQRISLMESQVYGNPLTRGFTRSRKSYAPTSRNRSRSSSVHLPKPSPANNKSGGATALVVIHTDDESLLLRRSFTTASPAPNSRKPYALSNLQKSCASFTSSSKKSDKSLPKKSRSLSKVPCSSQTVPLPQNGGHQHYREAIIM